MLYPEARKDAKNSDGEEPPTATRMVRSALGKAIKAWQIKNAKAYKKLKDAVGFMGWDNSLIHRFGHRSIEHRASGPEVFYRLWAKCVA